MRLQFVVGLLVGLAALPAQAKPDLIVQSIAVEPAVPNAGDGTIVIVFENIGPDDVNLSILEYTNYTVAIDGEQCNDGFIFDLDAGDTNEETAGGCHPSTPGEATITVTIDSDGDVDEADESNNTKSETFTWSGPDLVVKSIALEPATPNVTEGEITIVFENIGPYEGDTSTFDATNYTVALDGQQCDSGFLLNDLGPGETNQETTTNCNASTPGAHEISVTIDSDDDIAETDETNNTKTATFTWEGGPDLVVQDITLDPETPGIGDGTLTGHIANVGNAGTGILVNINVTMYLDGEECATGLIIAGLGAGSIATEDTGSCNPDTPGEHTIRYEVDTDDDVIEADESNNFLEKTFTWTASDLVITDIQASADPLEPGASNKFTATVKNQGPVGTGFFVNINLKMYLDGEECATGLVIAGLGAGDETTEETSQCNAATPGPHTVRFEVDTDEDVTELDETNNFLEKVFVWCGGEELCNSIDDDCDGETDEGFPIGDACDGPDADGCENGQNACGEDGAIVCVEEGDPAVEACNGEDDDCDGEVDEDFEQLGQGCDPEGECATGLFVCDDEGGVTCEAGAGATELCNGVDDDCDGEIDEDFVQLGASCAVGTGVCRAVGTYVCLDGAAKCDAVAGAPAASENCGDGLDNDCDGLVEETCPCDEGTYLLCGSTVGECTVGVQVCDGGVFASTCEDAVKAGSESCGDADDNDCDGVVDEGCPCVAGDSRPCGGPGACAASVQHCVQGLWGPCIGVAPTLEACDGKDDDCNGVVDDGCPCAGGVEACDQAPDSCADYARECNDGVWSACAAVEGTEDPDCFGDGGATTGDPGTGDAGTGDPGTGDTGTGDTGTGDTGTGDPGTGDPGTGATGDPGTGGTGDAGDGDTAGDGAGDGPEPGPGASPPTEDSGCTAGRGDRGWGLVFLFGLFGLAVLRFREPA